MACVLITGATGFVGRAVTRRFLAGGWSVVALSRDAAKARARVPASVPVMTDADLMAGRAPAEGFDAVVHLAGASLAGGPWTRSRKDVLWRSRVDGTHRLTAALGRLDRPPPVLVTASGMGYYGARGDAFVRPEDPPGEDFLGRMAAAWEEAARGAQAHGARVAMVRLGMVLDRGGGALGPLALATRWGLGTVLGDGRQYWPWMHRADVAELFWRAATEEGFRGPVHGVAGAPVTQREFADTLARVVGRPRLWRVPAGVLRAGLGGMSALFLHGQRVEADARLALRFSVLETALRAACAPDHPHRTVAES